MGLAVACAALAACNRTESNDARVELWTLALSPHFDGYMHDQISAFEHAYPGVKVEWVDIAYDALDRKLISAAAAGRAPDIVNMADLNFARYASLGAFRDIGNDLPADPAATYLPGALGLCTIGKHLLSLPWYVNPQTRIINTDVLKAGGIDAAHAPATWAEMMAAARAFHEKSGKYLFSQPLGEESQLPIMMLAEGLAPLRTRADGRLESNMSSPEVKAYLAGWVSLYRDGAMPREAATRGHAHLLDLYQDGRVAIISTGPNFLRRIKDVAPKAYSTTIVQPGAVGELGRVHMPVMVLAVTNTSKHPKDAAALAWFLTAAPAQTELCKLAPIMPSSSDSLKDPFFISPPAPGADVTLESGKSVAMRTLPEAVAFTASLDTWPDLRRAFEDEFKRVLLDGVDLDVALRRIDLAWNGILDAAPAAGIDCVPHPTKVAPPRPTPIGATP
jgi:putative chitobiose transport system substrate-binding protein